MYFYIKHSNVACEEFSIIKVSLCIVTRSSADNNSHGSCRTVEKVNLVHSEKVAKSTDADLTFYMFCLEEVVAHVGISNLSEILTIKS